MVAGQGILRNCGRNNNSPGTWKYDDKSFIHIDIPSPESDKIHQISREVHVTRVAPVQKGIDLHLSDLGIGVPSNSAPAHVLIVRDAELDKIVDGALKTPAKQSRQNLKCIEKAWFPVS